MCWNLLFAITFTLSLQKEQKKYLEDCFVIIFSALTCQLKKKKEKEKEREKRFRLRSNMKNRRRKSLIHLIRFSEKIFGEGEIKKLYVMVADNGYCRTVKIVESRVKCTENEIDDQQVLRYHARCLNSDSIHVDTYS